MTSKAVEFWRLTDERLTAERGGDMAAGVVRLVSVLAAMAVATPIAMGREAIVGGGEAQPGAWPSIVALVDPAAPNVFEGQFCSGALVAPGWVLTSANCVTGETGTIAPSEVRVVAGISDLSLATPADERAVSQILGHDGGPVQDTVALLALASPITSMAPIDLIDPREDGLWGEGASATVAGWGSTSPAEPFTFPTRLRELKVTIQSNATCSDAFGSAFLPSVQLCARGVSAAEGTCVADEGGPLVVTDAASKRVLVGLQQFNDLPCDVRPGIYVRLGEDALRNGILRVTTGSTPQRAPVSQLVASGAPALLTATWSQPRDATFPSIVGYRVRLTTLRRLLSGPVVPLRTVSTTQTQITFPGVVAGDYLVSVSAVNGGGAAPEVFSSTVVPRAPAVFTVRPTITGRARVGAMLTANRGAWGFPGDIPQGFNVAPLWQLCSVDLTSCVGRVIVGESGSVPRTAVGKRIRFRMRIEPFGLPESEAYSLPTAIIPPTVTVRARFRGVDRSIVGSIATQRGTSLHIRLLDGRGRPLRLDRRRSIIDGSRPTIRPNGLTLVTTVKKSSSPGITVASASRAATRRGTLVITATINGSGPTEMRVPVVLSR